MKRIIILSGAAGFALLFIVSAVEAASIGGPGFLPEKGRYVIAVEYDSLKERAFSDSTFSSQSVNAECKQYVAKVVYGLSHRVSVVVKGGSSDLKIWEGTTAKRSQSGGLAYGLGAKVIFYEDLNLGLNLCGEAQYFSFSPGDSGSETAKWKEWDGALFVTIVNMITEAESLVEPFSLTSTGFHAGLRYSNANIDWTSGSTSGTLEADDTVGFFGGFDFVFNDNYLLGIEARFSDEKAYTAALGFKF